MIDIQLTQLFPYITQLQIEDYTHVYMVARVQGASELTLSKVHINF